MAARLARSSTWGLDTSRRISEDVGLCTPETSHKWDLLPSTANGVQRLTIDNHEAKSTCWRCPIRPKCLTAYEKLPAESRASHIAGGFVFDSRGRRQRW
jgi:hypothetical protein